MGSVGVGTSEERRRDWVGACGLMKGAESCFGRSMGWRVSARAEERSVEL